MSYADRDPNQTCEIRNKMVYFYELPLTAPIPGVKRGLGAVGVGGGVGQPIAGASPGSKQTR